MCPPIFKMLLIWLRAYTKYQTQIHTPAQPLCSHCSVDHAAAPVLVSSAAQRFVPSATSEEWVTLPYTRFWTCCIATEATQPISSLPEGSGPHKLQNQSHRSIKLGTDRAAILVWHMSPSTHGILIIHAWHQWETLEARTKHDVS